MFSPLFPQWKQYTLILACFDSHQSMDICSNLKFTMCDWSWICFEQGLQGLSIAFLYMYKSCLKNCQGFAVRKCLRQGWCCQVWTGMVIRGTSVCLRCSATIQGKHFAFIPGQEDRKGEFWPGVLSEQEVWFIALLQALWISTCITYYFFLFVNPRFLLPWYVLFFDCIFTQTFNLPLLLP